MYEFQGYTFMFAGAEDVKRKYIKNYEYFHDRLKVNFPTKNIPYITAKGLAYGKSLTKLTQAYADRQEFNTSNESKGMFHKLLEYDRVAEKSSNLNVYLRELNKLRAKEEKYKDASGNVQYNIIHYMERV